MSDNAEQKYILAIDLGTSGPKVALASTNGKIIGSEFEKTEVILLTNGGAEQNPDDWWRGIKAATKRLLEKNLVPIDDIVAVNCTTQWSGTVAVDGDGNPLMNAVIWMDSRGARYIKEVTRGPINIQGYGIGKLITWLRLTGGAPGQAGKDSIAHILLIKNEFPGIYENTNKFLEPKDYLNLKLTGIYAASYDSITLHWCTDNRDISKIVYNDRLLRMAGIAREKLPDLRPAAGILGPIKKEIAVELGLTEDVRVVMGTPDVQSAAVGSGAVKDYDGHLYIGTSSWLTCHVPFKKVDLAHSMASLPSAIPGRYFVANEQESAGACLNFIRDNIFFHPDELGVELKTPDVYKTFDEIAAKVPAGSHKLIFTPWLFGERTPVEDHSVRSGFYNMSLRTTREHLIRSVYEGVAFNSRWLLQYVEKFIKRPMGTITMVGGGANSNIWCQIHADVLNRTIRQVKEPIRTNLRGAVFLASLALGYLKIDEIPERVPISDTFQPNPENREIYDDLFREFVKIYRRNKKFFARLNKIN
ncbi:MAG: FGGY-family carbohydrate kinase [Deltaproteobacteria bacterium]|nr:MAG: FGGY-family carbohydrate kinase [Deltaproteobacteria bacterium]